MENRSHALAAGLFTLLLLVVTIAIAMWLRRDQTDWVPYEIATRESVAGLNPQAAVRYRGLDVGRVDEIRFDTEQIGRILVRIRVRPETPVTHSTYASLGYQGVTGIAHVQLDDDGSQPVPLHSTESQPARIAMRPSLLDQLQQRGLAIMEQTEDVARRINTLLGDENQQAMLGAFADVSRAARELETVPRQLQPTLARLPRAIEQTHRTLASLEESSREATRLIGNLDGMVAELRAADGPLVRIGEAADQVGVVASKIEHETLPLATDIRSSIRALTRAMDSLADRPQSVLFGGPDVAPGPGEPGFVAPAPAR